MARGGVPVLAGVGFTLMPGQALILRGPNGSGKTTLLRTLAGIAAAAGRADDRLRRGDRLCRPCRRAEGDAQRGREPRVLGGGVRNAGHRRGDRRLSTWHHCATGSPARSPPGRSAGWGWRGMLVTGRPVWAMDEPTVSLDADAVGMFAAAVRRPSGRRRSGDDRDPYRSRSSRRAGAGPAPVPAAAEDVASGDEAFL